MKGEVVAILGRPRPVFRIRNRARQFRERQRVLANDTQTTNQNVDALRRRFNKSWSSKDLMATFNAIVAIMSKQQYRDSSAACRRVGKHAAHAMSGPKGMIWKGNIMGHRNIGLLLLAGAAIMPACIEASEPLPNVVIKWLNRGADLSSWEFECSTTDSVNVVNRTVRSAGTYFVSDVHWEAQKSAHESVRIINPKYAAEIERLDGSEWVLQKLRLAGDNGYKEFCDDMRGADYFVSKILNPGGIPDAFRAGDRVPSLRESRDGVNIVIEGTIILQNYRTQELTPRPIRLYFQSDASESPVRIDFQSADGREVSFCNKVAIDSAGQYLPEKCEIWTDGYYSADRNPSSSNTYRFISVNRAIDTQLCFLSHYGIPEPTGVTHANSPWITFVVAMAIVTTIWLVYRFRQSQA